MAEHEPVAVDAAEHQRTFEAFMRFWVYVFVSAIAVLIFLAIFNS
jgi:Bacterial aa3 type cytochrome c oxidase subunit IV